MSELKPCPFCGGEAYFERKGDRRQSTIVSCGHCGATLENGEEWGHGEGWNTRADLAEAPRAPGWRSMDSAPKDGTWFWGDVDGDAISMRWHEEFDAFVSCWREMTFAKSFGGGTRLHSPDIQHPTRWMPRPTEQESAS